MALKGLSHPNFQTHVDNTVEKFGKIFKKGNLKKNFPKHITFFLL